MTAKESIAIQLDEATERVQALQAQFKNAEGQLAQMRQELFDATVKSSGLKIALDALKAEPLED